MLREFREQTADYEARHGIACKPKDAGVAAADGVGEVCSEHDAGHG